MITPGFIAPDAPANPTTAGKQEVAIAPISNWASGAIGNVLVFPTTLDEARVKKAFARAASFWPSVVGRYVTASLPGPEFAFSFTNSDIPFSTQTTGGDQAFNNTNVIQDSLEPYLPPLGENFTQPDTDAALVAVRLTTLASGGSALGVNWSHLLGDGAACHRFLEDVSLFYNMPTADLDEDMPTLSPHVRLPPYNEEIERDFGYQMLTPHPREEVMKGYMRQGEQSHKFTEFLSPDDIKHLTQLRTPGERLSDSDLIAGWWVSVLERAGQRVDSLVQTINYRSFHSDHPAFPPNLKTLAANVAQQRVIPLPPSATSGSSTPTSSKRVLNIARTTRAGMNQLRNNPDIMLKWLSNAAHQIGTAAHNDLAFLLVPKPGQVVINSNFRYDWAIKFGQTSAQYYTNVSIVRFLRVFRANDSHPTGTAELVFRVENGPGVEAVEGVIASDRKAWAEGGAKGKDGDEEAAPEPEVRSFGFGQAVHRPSFGGYGV